MIFRRKMFFTLVFAVGLAGSPGHATEGTSPAAGHKQEAVNLLQLNETYFAERTRSDWEAIYNRQHPKFRKQVNLKYFKNKEGHIAYQENPSPRTPAKGNPFTVPQVKTVVKNKRDFLGFPTKRKYRIIANPWVVIDNHHAVKVALSADGRFGRVEMKLDVTETLPPALFRIDKKFPATRDHIDYWERVDGQWFVTLMVNRTSISGARIGALYIPNRIKELDSLEWIEFDPDQLIVPSPK